MPISHDVDPRLLADFRAGKRLALGRAMSLVENARPGFDALLHELRREMGRAHRVGVTGPPGAGKSTLTAKLVQAYRDRGETVGVVAVDPSSPFTGGALLGDRIRMNDLATDPGVFIRSMAARGSLGGLAAATNEVTDLLDAFGFDRVLAETVGVGQSELEIAGAADSTVVVLVPDSGDSIQAMKAGLMEIADIFVINKSDRPGADRLAKELEFMLHLRLGEGAIDGAGHHGARASSRPAETPTAGWSIPVLRTVGSEGRGVEALMETLDRHRAHLRESGELARRRRARLGERVRGIVDRELRRLAWERRGGAELLEKSLPELESGDESPYSTAARIVRAVEGESSG